jgi:alpha-beta hydrolase superfamily lysophospholipase
VGAVVLTARVLCGVAAASALAGTGFYAPPTPLPRAAPGTLIRSEPIAATAGARAWRVLYHSKRLDGRDVAESGVVVAPAGPAPAAGRPVVSWAHGTTGLADRCAPSRTSDVATTLPWIRDLVARGDVVAAADYEGLGTPGPHPYLVGESEGRSVLDAARAAGRLAAAGAGSTVVVAGHSQGGQAALFAGEIAPEYAPDLDVRGVAALAPATELSGLFAATQTKPEVQGFVAMVAQGIRAAFPKADVDAVVTPEAETALEQLDGAACLFTTLAGFRDRHLTVLKTDPGSVPSVADALRRSTAGNVDTRIPVAVYQGGQDALVPPAATAAYVARACARGDRVTAHVYPAAEHGTVLSVAAPDVLQWLDDRIAGNPVVTTC